MYPDDSPSWWEAKAGTPAVYGEMLLLVYSPKLSQSVSYIPRTTRLGLRAHGGLGHPHQSPTDLPTEALLPDDSSLGQVDTKLATT